MAPLNAFGLAIDADFAIPGDEDAVDLAASSRVSLRWVTRGDLWPLVSEPRVLRFLTVFDGQPFAMLEGPVADVLFCYGDRALFHLSEDRTLLRCAAGEPDDPAWQRVLLDTVLWATSCLRGHELLHASAVQTDDGVVAFMAGTGGGKTSLAIEFLRRGARLFADDIVALDPTEDGVIAHPGPPLVNLPVGSLSALGDGARVLGEFGDETWVRVARPTMRADRLAALFLVDRAPTLPSQCGPLDGTHLRLLQHLVGFPHLAAREATRFEVAAALASTTPVFHLTADTAATPVQLADIATRSLAST